MRHASRPHYLLTRLAIMAGPGNAVVQSLVRRHCARKGVTVAFSSSAVELAKASQVIRMAPSNWLYAPSVADNFDAYFDQVEPSREGDALVVDYSAPRLQRYRSSGLEFEINSFAEEEAAIADYMRWYRPVEGDVVFDLGAYCGVSTYAFSKAVGASGRVYAFEPDASSYRLLVRNIARHQLANVTALPLAIAPTTGEASFNQEGSLGSVLSRDSPRATTGVTSMVQTISLADACDRFGAPAFVKMDIEGSELEVLGSSRELLIRTPINLALDTHHAIDGMFTADRVERILEDCGYETSSSDASGFWTTWARPSVRPA